jgi:peptidoglycan/xylan/chitin deacetylase (PgdA/CDA1 family)
MTSSSHSKVSHRCLAFPLHSGPFISPMRRFTAFLAVFVPLAAFCANPALPTTAAPKNTPSKSSEATAPKTTFSQCHVTGNYVALTFDDGPSPENTPRLLDMLRKRGLKATFFIVGQCAAQNPEILKRIASEGHEIGNHSWSHPSLAKMGELGVTEQLQRTHEVVQQLTGTPPKLMRPPYGAFTTNQRAWAHQKWGYKTILWDVDPLDWKVRNANRVQAEILRQTVSGSIILAHDIHASTVDAMPATLDALLAKGCQFVTVSELLAMDQPPKTQRKDPPDSPTPIPSKNPDPTPAPASTPAP